MSLRRRARFLLVVIGAGLLTGCTGDPGLCAQLGSLGLCG